MPDMFVMTCLMYRSTYLFDKSLKNFENFNLRQRTLYSRAYRYLLYNIILYRINVQLNTLYRYIFFNKLGHR